MRACSFIRSGDLTDGAASTGGVLGALLSVDADESGRAHQLTSLACELQVWDIIGRALVVAGPDSAVAAVLARSAVAGDNTKKVCACDGTLIWTSGDLIPRK